ncbi:MAG: tRNA pseudouridine13 synthase [Moritella dasanensis]|jgi:tRNA pseudouridine13 synthase
MQTNPNVENTMLPEFEYLYGKPTITGFIKQEAADFVVIEDLGFELTGEGEHIFISIRKEGENTQYVARALAKAAGVADKHVSYAGLKDRHAITEQWFGIHMPGKETPDFSSVETDQITVLKIVRHNKKLRTGALKGNQFTLKLTDLSSTDGLEERLEKIKTVGVPNYFGEQRFGRNGSNITAAQEMFAGKTIRDRNKRSFYISAARSLIFNAVVSERISQAKWQTPMPGDCLVLQGSNSFFAEETLTDDIIERVAQGALQLSAPLVGKGNSSAMSDALAFEDTIIAQYPELLEGLVAAGLRQERKALILRPQNFSYELAENSLTVSFYLPSGCFATSVVRELIEEKFVVRHFDQEVKSGDV